VGFSYLDGKNWLNVTREERLFCSYLYHDLRGREMWFVEWLNKHCELELSLRRGWEIGFEVCFYRDLQAAVRMEGLEENYSPKRTFDLCLFSEDAIVIIEAKVHERFDSEQVGELIEDKRRVGQIIGLASRQLLGTGKAPNVLAIALASSKYFTNVDKYGRGVVPMKEAFEGRITWYDMYKLVGNPLYEVADMIYPHSIAKTVGAQS